MEGRGWLYMIVAADGMQHPGLQAGCHRNRFHGSTTTKVVVLDEDNRILYSTITTTKKSVQEAVKRDCRNYKECVKEGTSHWKSRGCSTGYGGSRQAAFRWMPKYQ
ncbi:MAG: hypothetical protein ACLSFW_06925 [Bacteroides cellulosilyticus]